MNVETELLEVAESAAFPLVASSVEKHGTRSMFYGVWCRGAGDLPMLAVSYQDDIEPVHLAEQFRAEMVAMLGETA